ncbi:MAG: metal ABC transporter permease [Candidatus Woesebacteria bacterium]|nr:metal ABC transporter permease [Candidatus Woesebacteria bacterium]
MTNTNIILLLITGALVGGVSGYLGSFMVLKRMSLVGDALSHVALPGMAIALILNLNPTLGAFIALTLAVIGVWYLSEKSEIYPEALVGVFFTASLAIGILITPEPELLEALFGNFEKINLLDGVIIAASSVLIFTLVSFIAKRLLLGIVSEDLAKAEGINMKKVNLIYLLLVGFVVALGVKFVGTLLMGALVVVPAVAAKNLAKSIKSYQILGALLGVVSVVFGLVLSKYFNFSSGPIIVLVSIFIFIVSYIFKRK